MGTDINLCVEIKERNSEDWRPILVPNPLYDKADPESNPYSPSRTYNGRNRDLFAILAGMGNQVVGPGGNRYDKFTIISRPRGLPPDVSQEVRRAYEILQAGYDGCDDDCFYASWLTIREILEFDWDQVTKEKEMYHITEYEYGDLLRGEPRRLNRNIDASKIRDIPRSEMDQILSGELPREDGAVYFTQIELNRTYRECISPFLEFCDYLDFQFSQGSNAERGSNVRIVFWFDF
ncbi:MAG: hypothetical protein CVV31_10100 [Methanomicrobiales archaeon HGW-Methanomicrobiales-2]|jgi:hypothetical protein|nr:MAG: hypothetical protein CVV31_10100 [Methanomicrobiales archaeon HGW-Methanomicrobiales-2]